MIESELLRDRGILILSPDGPLEKSDFERIARDIDPFIASNGKLNGLMICAKAFPGWDSFGALVSHIRFVKDHHRKIERIAAVTDSDFLTIMPHIAKHFISADVRQFAFEKRKEALAWLDAGR
jgi:SpoIIAA-like